MLEAGRLVVGPLCYQDRNYTNPFRDELNHCTILLSTQKAQWMHAESHEKIPIKFSEHWIEPLSSCCILTRDRGWDDLYCVYSAHRQTCFQMEERWPISLPKSPARKQTRLFHKPRRPFSLSCIIQQSAPWLRSRMGNQKAVSPRPTNTNSTFWSLL